MSVGVDLDEVLVPYLSLFCPFYNETYHPERPFTPEDFFSYRYADVLGISPDECREVVRVFERDSARFREQRPLPGAVEGVKALARSHRLYVITSRTREIEVSTRALLERYFGGLFEDVFFTDQHTGDASRAKLKSSICRQLGCSVFIDDSPYHCADVAQSCGDTRVILFGSYPWNWHARPCHESWSSWRNMPDFD